MLNIEKNSMEDNLECIQDTVKEIQALLKLGEEGKQLANCKLIMMWWGLDDLVKKIKENENV
jgi:hypothetical protein